MGWESSDVVRFDLGPLLQGQMRIAKLKSTYNSIIKMLFIFKTMLLVLLWWIHLASDHRGVLGLVLFASLFVSLFVYSISSQLPHECL